MEYDFLITILISIVNLSSFLYMYFFPKLSMELKHKKIRGIYTWKRKARIYRMS